MVSTFLKRSRRYWLGVVLNLISSVVLMTGYALAIVMIKAERNFSQTGKLTLIGLSLIIGLIMLGLVEQTRL